MHDGPDFDSLRSRVLNSDHWELGFAAATQSNTKQPTERELEALVRSSAVTLKFWEFPSVSHTAFQRLDGSVRGADEINGYSEFWQLFGSGAFGHASTVQEDRPDFKEQRAKVLNRINANANAKCLDIQEVLRRFTEACLFVSRLSARGLFAGDVTATVNMTGMNDRYLVMFDGRYLWSRKLSAPGPVIEFSIEFQSDQIVADPRSLARKLADRVFERFHFDEFSDDVFRDLQTDIFGSI